MKRILLSIMVLFSLIQVTPVYAALDYSGLVQCDGVVSDERDVMGGFVNEPERQRECDFAALMSMVNYIIKWVFGLTIPIFVGLMAYAGFLYMTPNPSNRALANKVLWAGIKGFVIMLVAWFLVTTLLSWLVSDTFKEPVGALLEQNK